MKKITLLFCLLLSIVAFAQNSEKKVWDLLLANKRAEARKLFDKDLKSQIDKNIDYLILDALIHIESGKTEFDDSFAKKDWLWKPELDLARMTEDMLKNLKK